MTNRWMTGAVGVLLLAGCASGDPYYAAVEDAFEEAGADMAIPADERPAFYEDMAAELCGILRDGLLAGDSDEQVIADMLDAMGGNIAIREEMLEIVNATLDYRCDATQPDGLKTP